MKKITLLSMFLFSLAASAQVTYLSSDFAAAGEEFTVSKASGFIGMNFATSGANHSWNYSGLAADSQTSASWQDPNGSGYKLAWCLSHFYLFTCNSQFNSNFTHSAVLSDGFELMDYGVSNIVEHSRANATGFANRMRGMTATVNGISIPMTVEYSDPDEIYNFPMVYNDSYTTTGLFTLDLNNLSVPFSYTLATARTNTVQGWGSLTTPMGTFPDVLKLKSVIAKNETYVYNGINIPINTTAVSYQWFSKDYGMPVLQADGMEVFGIFIPLTVSYIDQQQCLTADAAFTYLPVADYDPDSQTGIVSFQNLSSNYSNVSWDFGDGNTSTAATPSHAYSCPGTHQVTLTVSNMVCQPNTTDTFMLPVIVTDSQNAYTIDVTASETGLSTDRDLSGTTYQWVDCDNANAAIAGENNQAFSPVVSGNYACILTTNGCESITACTPFSLLGTNHFDYNGIRLYPNPTTGILQLSGALTVNKVAIYNTLGMKVANTLDITSQASGLYFVEITTPDGSFIKKVIKQ
ncbi:MAG TPA: PKD domain-containing protein [Flavobacterium sp.]|nr:PKD domain-containing protein [Flavobacterium sp.]